MSACLDVDPSRRPTTGELLNVALFNHDEFNVWFLSDLRTKLQEEFGANPLLRKKKHLYSANRQKSGSDEFYNKKNRDKSTVSKIFLSQVYFTQSLLFPPFLRSWRKREGPVIARVCLMRSSKSLWCTPRNTHRGNKVSTEFSKISFLFLFQWILFCPIQHLCNSGQSNSDGDSLHNSGKGSGKMNNKRDSSAGSDVLSVRANQFIEHHDATNNI